MKYTEKIKRLTFGVFNLLAFTAVLAIAFGGLQIPFTGDWAWNWILGLVFIIGFWHFAYSLGRDGKDKQVIPSREENPQNLSNEKATGERKEGEIVFLPTYRNPSRPKPYWEHDPEDNLIKVLEELEKEEQERPRILAHKNHNVPLIKCRKCSTIYCPLEKYCPECKEVDVSNVEIREQWRRELITFSDNWGSSVEDAIVIRGAESQSEGIAVEHRYLQGKYGERREDWDLLVQQLIHDGGRSYDQMELSLLPDGFKETLYFDITDFFGKQTPALTRAAEEIMSYKDVEDAGRQLVQNMNATRKISETLFAVYSYVCEIFDGKRGRFLEIVATIIGIIFGIYFLTLFVAVIFWLYENF